MIQAVAVKRYPPKGSLLRRLSQTRSNALHKYAEDIVQRLWPAIRDYLDEAERRSRELGYALESIRKHREAAAEYFRHVPAA